MLTFFLGTHRPGWLSKVPPDVPLCVSRRTLADRKRLPKATGPWALDSGGYTQLTKYGRYTFTAAEYIAEVKRFRDEIGRLAWAAPMDWMCEDKALAMTGLTVKEHQLRTIDSWQELNAELGDLVIPVLQGWEWWDYIEHVGMYQAAGVDLWRFPTVGVGSICRRGQDAAICDIVTRLHDMQISMHGFGVRGSALKTLAPLLMSADSMAWSYAGRRMPRRPGCTHRGKNEQNCMRWALDYRQHRLWDISQGRIECAA